MKSPYYDLVPKDVGANLRFRREMVRLGGESKENARELWVMSARDLLFYVNTFVWTYDPRRKPNVLPFVTWEFQDEALSEIDEAIETGQDVLFEKSRDMGASWMALIVFEWRWHFQEGQSFLLVSRVENLVDKTGDMDALMPKIDFMHKYEPRWLLPTGRWLGRSDPNRTHLCLKNADNDSLISGASTTGDVSRGGRRTSLLLDEFAAVPDGFAVRKASADVTDCRIFNSTHKGTGTAFYETSINPEVRKIRLHWSRHPRKAMGLYKAREDGTLEVLDVGYDYPPDYAYVLDGKLRSPWYDREDRRRAHPMEVAQELDIDPLGSDYQFFDADALEKVRREQVRPPYLVGDVEYDPDTLEVTGFTPNPGGMVSLWVYLDARNRVPADRSYGVGCDVATGTGASNSVGSVGDLLTREKVAEVVSSSLKPHEFAKVMVAICKWFRGGPRRGPEGTALPAFLIWEANGPGRIFGDTVIRDCNYLRVYRRSNDASLRRKVSDVPGWFSTRESKLLLLGDYRKRWMAGEFTNRSRESYREALEYVFQPSGTVEHSRAVSTVDPTGARDNHGDRVIADALLVKLMEQPREVESLAAAVPDNCFLARRQLALAAVGTEEERWRP